VTGVTLVSFVNASAAAEALKNGTVGNSREEESGNGGYPSQFWESGVLPPEIF